MKNTFIDNLNWRFATKTFINDKSVSAEDFQKIKDSIRLAPTAFGLQPFRVVVVEKDSKLKSDLISASFNKSQLETASHLLIFISNSDVQKRIGAYCDLAEFKSKGMLNRVAMEAGMRAAFVTRSDEAKFRWATNQTYIALGFALAACAELGIDSCPMEGFSSDKVGELLGLADCEYAATMLAIGYRAEEPTYEKTRFAEENMFKTV